MKPQCNQSPYPTLMKQNCTHNPSTSQVRKSNHCNPVAFPYPPDPGEHTLMKQTCTHNPSTSQVRKNNHSNPVAFPYPPDPREHVLERSATPTALVKRDKFDLFQSSSTKRADGKFFQLDLSFQESHINHFMFW